MALILNSFTSYIVLLNTDLQQHVGMQCSMIIHFVLVILITLNIYVFNPVVVCLFIYYWLAFISRLFHMLKSNVQVMRWRAESATHLCTCSDNCVHVALKQTSLIVVSDQWCQVLILYSCREALWVLLHAQVWLSWYTWDQQLYMVSEPRETQAPMLLIWYPRKYIITSCFRVNITDWDSVSGWTERKWGNGTSIWGS